MQGASRTMKIVTGILEAILAIPVLGGLIVVATGYVPLGLMLILHIVTLILSSQERSGYLGSVFGIITSILAWIPFLGFFMHIISAILLLISAFSRNPYGNRAL